MTDTVSVLSVSDMHINSTVALSPPKVNLVEGGTYVATRSQRALWERWTGDLLPKFDAMPGRKVLVFNGDMGELDAKKRTVELVSINKATILELTLETIMPIVDRADAVYVMRGTPAHTGKGAWLEEVIAKDIDAVPTDEGTASWWHMRRKAAGVRFDIAHHASMGHLPWTEKNAANKVAAIIMWRYMIDMEELYPHITLRNHNHRYADSGGNYKTFAICGRAWSTATDYTYRTGKENSPSDIGADAFICKDGKYEHIQHCYPYKPVRKIWANVDF